MEEDACLAGISGENEGHSFCRGETGGEVDIDTPDRRHRPMWWRRRELPRDRTDAMNIGIEDPGPGAGRSSVCAQALRQAHEGQEWLEGSSREMSFV